MNTQTLHPASRQDWLALRSQDLTSTEVSALFGVNPWLTKYELFFQHRDNSIVEIEETNRMRWGKRLEQAIALCAADDKGWSVKAKTEYIRWPALRLGASFDYEAVVDGEPVILEIKNVDSFRFKEGWLVDEDGNVEAPPHIEIQLQQQLMLTGYKRGFIIAFVGGNDIRYLERAADENVQAAIVAEAKKFWELIEKNTPPEPDFARDASFIISLHQSATKGKVLDSSADPVFNEYALAYKAIGEQIKALEIAKSELKAKLLTAAGDAEKVVGPWGSLSLGITNVGEKVVAPYSCRRFHPYFKKDIQ